MHCLHCEHPNTSDDAYCDGCGRLLGPSPVATAPVEPEPQQAPPDEGETAAPEPLPSPPAPEPFQLHLEYDPRLNLAMQQNSIPTVKRLTVTGEPGRRVEVRVELESGLSEPWSQEAVCPARLESVRPVLRPERLVNVLEREQGSLRVDVLVEGQVHQTRSWPLEVLAYNEWNGSCSLPELLSAFVMPNHPALEPLLKRASTFLEEWTQDASLDGYQSKSRERVRQIAAALFDAVQDLGITYVTPPASFEKAGQKIRTPDQVVDARMGTCLDLSVLLAAAMEQVGLNALLVVVKGHAFPGVWLIDHHGQKTFSEDPDEAINRCKLGEICFFDSSAAAQKLPFERAEQAALSYLEQRELVFALDLKACRLRRFLPLPMRVRDGFTLVSHETTEYAPQAPSGELPALATPSGERKSLDPASARLERWKNRLLDLTLRNRLLNYKTGSKSLPLLGPAAELEDRLYQMRAKGLQLYPRPDRRDPRQLEGADLPDLVVELGQGRVYVDLTRSDLDKRVLDLFRTARTTMEETGSNTLYLAVGFLRWFETTSSEREIRSPLILYPAEIVRGSVQDPFRLRLTDEEPRVNATLLRKLHTDFGMDVSGLDELPEDDDGVDVPAVMQRFRQAVVSIPRWGVIEEAQISLFSFAKYLMWLDLEQRRDQLLESPAVARLVTRQGNADPLPDYPRLDEARPPSEVLCLVDADSSQLEAIYSAEDGHSFVLEGPPGTGKSQTITNLIAQMLGRGRSVLFVSEKQCALNVVHHRLAQVGLGPFCLELHSNKASKSELLNQLRQTVQAGRTAPPRDWAPRSHQLAELRQHLNDYCEAVHRPRALGLTVYQVIGELTHLGPGPRAELGDLGDLSRETMLRWEQNVELLQRAAATVGAVATHPCRGVQVADWTQEWQDAFQRSLSSAQAAWGQAAESLERLCGELGLPARDYSLADMDRCQLVCRNALATPGETRGLLTGPGWKERRRQAEEWLGWADRRRELWQGLEPSYDEKLLSLELDGLQSRFELASKTNGLVAFFKFWGDRGKLKPVVRGKRKGYAQLVEDLKAAREIVNLDRQLGEAPAQALFGTVWQGWKSDTAELRARLDWSERTRQDLIWLEDSWRSSQAAQRLVELTEQGSDLAGRAAGQALHAALAALDRLGSELDQLRKLALIEQERVWGPPDEPGGTGRMARSLQGWRENPARMRDWSLYIRARDRVAQEGLEPLTWLHAEGKVSNDELISAFRRSVLGKWLSQTVAAEPVLKHFHGDEQNTRVSQFQALDKQLLSLARQEVVARLSGSIPDLDRAPDASEAGVLKREFQKQRRHLPIRKLFQQAPRLVRQLKPCFLMSPLSVAQFLDPAMPAFDLVVFDEASQIPVWDGIGALARGRQAIIVGDSKQLPPTAFFARGDSDPDLTTEEDYEDLESILNEAGSAGLPSRFLRWHYRSKHEALIHFSNHHYYESRLFTFPPALAQSGRFGVSLVHVPGYYDRGGSRTNRFEAQAVVADIVRRLTDPRESQRSIGVVTFSQPQQVLVEDLLDQARREHPEIERHFGPSADEPVFVKNLENVQGDERDVILFSIGYGPDAQGKVLMNFGPLNREGGERRLNVAVSRARQQLVVFSTLRPEQIDLTRVSARGVRDLKNYLEFAARGPSALPSAPSVDPGGEHESLFEEVVAGALRQKGWQLHAQVGCSGYRVDLGVIDPEVPGRYLMGVECDGESYHSARCARDRDRLRESVLRSLGWELVRVWSSDWWADPEGQLERVDRALVERLRRVREAPEAPPEPEPPPVLEAPPLVMPEEEPDLEPPPVVHLPRVTARMPIDHVGSRDEVRALVEAVLGQAPVSLRLATSQVVQPWGMKVTARVQSLVARCALSLGAREHEGFLWRADQDPLQWREFRGGPGRKLEEISLQELANGGEILLQQYGSMPRVDFARQIALLFGCRRLGANAQAQLDRAIGLLLGQGRARELDGRVCPAQD